MIDQYQRQLRAGKGGGSDAAAICGMDPWKTAYDVWAVITGKAPGFTGNDATEIGTYVERGLLDWLQDEIDTPVQRDQCFLSSDGFRICNLDGLILADAEPATVECKAVNIFGHGRAAEEWGDETMGAEGVPPRVLIQVHHGFSILDEHHPGIRQAHVVALVFGHAIRRYRVQRNDELVAAVAEAWARFKRDHIDTGIPPADSRPSLEVAKALIRVPNKVVAVPDELVARWMAARDARLAAEKAEDAAKAELLGALEDAEAGQCSAGTVTFYEQVSNYKAQPERVVRSRKLMFKANRQIGQQNAKAIEAA